MQTLIPKQWFNLGFVIRGGKEHSNVRFVGEISTQLISPERIVVKGLLFLSGMIANELFVESFAHGTLFIAVEKAKTQMACSTHFVMTTGS
jgi:hypothetical protein